jgi:hypothetical protein
MKKFLIISLFFLSFIPVIVAADPTNIDPDVGTTLTTNCPSDTPDCYQLLEPIKLSDELTINSIDTAVNAAEGGGIGGFMNFLFEVAIGIAGVLGVVMLVYYGFRYAANDKNINEFSQLREKVTNVVLGLLLLLGTFVILKTINPDLLIVEPVFSPVELKLESTVSISDTDYQAITGTTKLNPTAYDTMAKDVATSQGVEYCVLKVMLERESKGDPGAIGYDENTRSTSVPSRIAFINSQKKYSGETFIKDSNLIKKKGFVNNGTFDPKREDLGLDWRFSKGIGLTQITFFPNGYFSAGYKVNPPAWETRTSIIKRELYPGGPTHTPRQMIDAKTNLEAGAKLWKYYYQKCGSIIGGWRAWGAGSCNANNGFINTEAPIRTQLYNDCKKANP